MNSIAKTKRKPMPTGNAKYVLTGLGMTFIFGAVICAIDNGCDIELKASYNGFSAEANFRSKK